METDFLVASYNIISIIFTVAATAGLVWQMGRWINRRADSKASVLKQHVDEKAQADKNDREGIAHTIRAEAEERDKKLREFSTGLINDMREAAAKDNTDLIIKVGLLEDRLNGRIEKVDVKLMEMLTGLTKRSDLVNGNIANIRADIADLQEDIAETSIRDETPANAKARLRSMRIKRRRIEADRVAQQER